MTTDLFIHSFVKEKIVLEDYGVDKNNNILYISQQVFFFTFLTEIYSIHSDLEVLEDVGPAALLHHKVYLCFSCKYSIYFHS